MTQQPLKTVLATIAEHHDGVRQGGSLYELQADGETLIVDVATGWQERHRYVLRADVVAGPTSQGAAPRRCAVSQRLGSLTQVPCAPHRTVDDACIAHRPIACVLVDGHDEPCEPGVPPLHPDWTLAVEDLCAQAVRDVLTAADRHHGSVDHVDPADPVQIERAWAAKAREVAGILRGSELVDDDYTSVFFPSGVRDEQGRMVGASAGFFADGEHAGLWGYESAAGARVASELRWSAPATWLARWTRERRVQPDLLDAARLAYSDGDTDAPLCPCGSSPMANPFYPVRQDGTLAPEGGSGYVLCTGCGRVFTDAPSVAGTGPDVVEDERVIDDERYVYFQGAGVQVAIVDRETVWATRP